MLCQHVGLVPLALRMLPLWPMGFSRNQWWRRSHLQEDVFRANERASSSLEIMQVILAGSLMFDFMDRVTCLYMSLDHTENPFKVLGETPGLWLGINVVFFLLCSYLLLKGMRYLGSLATGTLTCRMELNRKASIEHLDAFLEKRHMDSEEEHYSNTSRYRKVSWYESDSSWGAKKPKIELLYDVANGFILKAFIVVDRNNGHWTQDRLETHFIQFMEKKKVLVSGSSRRMSMRKLKTHDK